MNWTKTDGRQARDTKIHLVRATEGSPIPNTHNRGFPVSRLPVVCFCRATPNYAIFLETVHHCAAPRPVLNQFPLFLKSQQIAFISNAGFLGAVAPTPCREEVRS